MITSLIHLMLIIFGISIVTMTTSFVMAKVESGSTKPVSSLAFADNTADLWLVDGLLLVFLAFFIASRYVTMFTIVVGVIILALFVLMVIVHNVYRHKYAKELAKEHPSHVIQHPNLKRRARLFSSELDCATLAIALMLMLIWLD